jgi:repressor of nif and glnA expression
MAFASQGVERKELAIMRILSDSPEPLGARVIAQQLRTHGFELGERAVRYHLKLLDERGLTHLVGQRDGRQLTEKGRDELQSALVQDKVGFTIAKIETLSFRTTFDRITRTGTIPVNISLFNAGEFENALKIMRPVFEAGFCISDLVAIATEGKKLGEFIIPPGKAGLATVCSIVFNGVLLKAGIPMDSRFGGILQLRNQSAIRFVELIDYNGCSLDPSTIFIKAKMTSVGDTVKNGEGKVLANFREIPSICMNAAESVINDLNQAGFQGLIMKGDMSEPVCEIAVEVNKAGIVLLGGMNPVAAAEEAGFQTDNHAMSTVIEYEDLINFREAVIEYRDLVRFHEISRH